jgi:CelD/BcsL family acetyltransferase involved in cellulose biosynthesis
MSATYLVRQHATLEEIGPKLWDDLAARSPSATFFQGWTWNDSWWSARRDPEHTLAMLSVWRDGRLVGLAPLQVGEQNPRLGRALSFIGQGNSDYQDFLVDRDEPGVVDALVDAIARLPERWERFQAFELPEGSLLRGALETSHRTDRFRLERRDDTVCPYFDIVRDPNGFATLADKQSARRKAAQIARLGEVTVEHLFDEAAIMRELPMFFRQHAERWAVTQTPSPFLDPAARLLYESLARGGAPRGEVLLSVLRLGGRPVAYHFGFLHRERLIWYKPSFDLRFFRAAPGNGILRATIRLAVERGLHELDFTRGDEGYKNHFTNAQRRNANWIWYRTAEIHARGAAMRAARAELRSVVGMLRPGEPSAAGAVKQALSELRGFLVSIDRVAWCTVLGSSAMGAREIDLDWFLSEADLIPGSASTDLLTDAFQRIHARQVCVAPAAPDPPRAAAWLDDTGRIVDLQKVSPEASDEHLVAALRAAAAAGGNRATAVAVVLGSRITRETIRRAGFTLRSMETGARIVGTRWHLRTRARR